ncbi:deoxyribodipyrimidine photolyase [Methylophaga muralis]|uniref:Deoxyribodipyrimidine photolyase n=1 Tax=Methylophaga muralis TaxID=291169 RepID=A0A1E3GQZ3_9GAMM|nr:deoxyribodipyrimidine photolyase [Methylophaga muralis]
MQATQLVWLRNDLRLDDHPGLALAAEQGPIQVVFCATPEQWKQHDESPARLGFALQLCRISLIDLPSLAYRFIY